MLSLAKDAHQAETCFQQALEVARRQRALSFELRAATSLGRLLRQTDRTDEARRILADCLNSFTEGFDTSDLVEAKSLLDEL
jgi:predicted ATPase